MDADEMHEIGLTVRLSPLFVTESRALTLRLRSVWLNDPSTLRLSSELRV